MTSYVLGVDNGGTAIKAGLFDESGVRTGLATAPSPAVATRDGRVEIDLDELWSANVRCITAVVRESGIDPSDVRALGFAGQGKGLFAIDAAGRPVGQAITSADDRAREVAERWAADGTTAAVTAITGSGVFSSQPITMLAWLKSTDPDAYARIATVFSMKDYLVFRATGERVSDPSNQSGAGFMDIRTRQYAPQVLDLLGIPEIADALPSLREAAEIAGSLTAASADELGLPTGTSVITGLFDINASAVAAGVVDDSSVCMITGTAGVNIYASPAPVLDGSVAMNSFYCVPGYYLVEEGSNSSVGTLEWAIDTLYPAERSVLSGGDLYGEMERIAGGVDPRDSGVVFLPYLSGDGGTGRARGTWLGLTAGDRAPELLRAVYEGVVFAHRRHVDRLRGDRAVGLTLAGGGARSALVARLMADVMQAPVRVVDEDELGTRGLAVAAGIASGLVADFPTAVAELSPAGAVIEPDPALAELYKRKYRRFLAALDALDGLWA